MGEVTSMSAQPPIRSLFASDINRTIEEVIKVDQNDSMMDHIGTPIHVAAPAAEHAGH